MKKSIGTLILSFLFLQGCGYELVKGPGLPSGAVSTTTTGALPTPITSLNLPVFKNLSFEPQVPMFFTEAFSQELAASGLVPNQQARSRRDPSGHGNQCDYTLSALSGQGLATQKTVTVFIALNLSQRGKVLKSWTFGDSEAYDVTSINSEDFNKRAAIIRLAQHKKRIARVFHSQSVRPVRCTFLIHAPGSAASLFGGPRFGRRQIVTFSTNVLLLDFRSPRDLFAYKYPAIPARIRLTGKNL